METFPWSLKLFLICAINLHNSLNLQAYMLLTNLSFCSNTTGYYTRNSLYETNLVSLLSSSPSKINDTGFYTESIGNIPNNVTVVMWCRADMQLPDCRNCIRTASEYILTSCPFYLRAVYYYLDCTVTYTNEVLLGIYDAGVTWSVWDSADINADVIGLNDVRGKLLTSLLDKAAGENVIKVATGNATIPADYLRIYAILQCMPYVSYRDCFDCLQYAITLVGSFNNASNAYGVCSPICRVQTATKSFFNGSRIDEVQNMFLAPPLTNSSLPPSQPEVVQPSSTSPTASPSPHRPHQKSYEMIIIASVAAAGSLIFIGGAIILAKKWKKSSNDSNLGAEVDKIIEEESLQYDFDRIRLSTNDFSEEKVLGHGGFGFVYKGTLENGAEIAVKRLVSGSSQGDMEFKNEVILLGKLHHRNLVKFHGFALQGRERVLIYEYLQNGSLDKFIFDSTKSSSMDWNSRRKIIEGIVKGLVYLHDDSGFCIIHRDLKLSNILLDDKMNPKIADFGLAKLFKFDESYHNTSIIVGTPGYMAPEYNFNGEISIKTDVFSLGVLILEIVSGQKRSSFIIDGIDDDMLIFAWKRWSEGKGDVMVDPVLRANSGCLQDILRCIHIGLLCVQSNAVDRPSMPLVLQMLKSSSITLRLPSMPPFSISDSSKVEQVMVNNKSSNEVSISYFQPR